ncbi:hypothetical protein P3X46_007238 [Hevea brasiliensis]|uniref:Pentacotripeptide-repeat region of PRORP domain-containing protein n=1 Tax=Hevea brasiliensis TaxID=3981 RepID=A0ABQ9MUX6_HEVBR|nr:putative pentatricopeptide repeat-containing protein At1g74580 [Hevea brasiliensis]KAJ9183375.1 hypothetical protein P3X46_007238 [Hevea brasiliensis]
MKNLKMQSLKQAQRRLQFLSHPSEKSIIISPLLQQAYASSSSSSSEIEKPTNSKLALTQQELTKINLLIPRLCLSDHLSTAIHLTATALLTNPAYKSISFSILIHSLTSQPDMTKSMSLLTILRHTPQAHPHLTRITVMLVSSYVKKKRPKEAYKLYQWMLRPGFPCKVEKIVYKLLVNGFCECGLILEAFRVLRDMVGVGFVPGSGLRRRVYRSLLREARVWEAVRLDEALRSYFGDANSEGVKKVMELLDSTIGSWTE